MAIIVLRVWAMRPNRQCLLDSVYTIDSIGYVNIVQKILLFYISFKTMYTVFFVDIQVQCTHQVSTWPEWTIQTIQLQTLYIKQKKNKK